jgi:MFS family permease
LNESAKAECPEAPQTTLRAIIAVIASTVFLGLAYGYSMPVLSLIMERAGVSSTVIGLNTACSSAAVLTFGPLVPRVLGRFGLRGPMFVSIMLAAALIPLIALTEPLYAWFPLRFVLGGTVFTGLIASDIWVTQGANPSSRGRLVGFYGSAIAGGVAAGPLLIALTGSDGWEPFAAAGGLLVAALVPLFFTYGPAPHIDPHQVGRLHIYLLAVPVAAVAVFVFGVMDSSILAFLPIYGLRFDFSETEAVGLVSMVLAGSVFLQVPIGFLADHSSKSLVLAGCGVVGAAAAAALPFLMGGGIALWAVLFLLGGSVSGLYVISLAILGDRFQSGALATAVTVFTMLVALGATIGPMASGVIMKAYDPHGLPVTTGAAMFAVPFAAIIWFWWRCRATRRT